MFLTLRGVAQELATLALVAVEPVARLAVIDEGALEVAAEAASTLRQPSAGPTYPQRVDLGMIGQARPANSSRGPVTMLTTPAGTSEVSSTW